MHLQGSQDEQKGVQLHIHNLLCEQEKTKEASKRWIRPHSLPPSIDLQRKPIKIISFYQTKFLKFAARGSSYANDNLQSVTEDTFKTVLRKFQ